VARRSTSSDAASARKPRWLWRYYFLFVLVLVAGVAALAYPKIRLERSLESARKELGARHLLNAQDKIDTGLQRWPDDRQFHFLAARCARLRGDYLGAEKHLKRCQDDDELKADVLLERALMEATRGNLAGMETNLQKLVEERNPDRAWILEALAEGHRKQFQFTEALNCADQWLNEEPDSPPALRLKAECVNQRAGAAGAVPIYQRALERDPEYDEARYQLAQLFLDGPAKDSKAALVHFEVLYRHRPDSMGYKLGYAAALVDNDHADQAQSIVKEILAKQPKLAPAMELRGRIALAQGRADDALPWLQQAVERDPGRDSCYFMLAQCLKQLGDETKARQIEKQGSDVQKDKQRLFELTSRLIPESPHSTELYFEAGQIELRYQRPDAALIWFSRALGEDPKHIPTHRLLAEYFEKAGNLPMAKYHREFLTKK